MKILNMKMLALLFFVIIGTKKLICSEIVNNSQQHLWFRRYLAVDNMSVYKKEFGNVGFLLSTIETDLRENDNYYKLNTGKFFDKRAYEKRLGLELKELLLYAEDQGRTKKQKLYAHVVNLDETTWAIGDDEFAKRAQIQCMLNAYINVIKTQKLTEISDINFSCAEKGTYELGSQRVDWDGKNPVSLTFNINDNQINFHFSKKNSSTQLEKQDKDKLLMAMCIGCGNSGESWIAGEGILCISGGSVADSSLIKQLQDISKTFCLGVNIKNYIDSVVKKISNDEKIRNQRERECVKNIEQKNNNDDKKLATENKKEDTNKIEASGKKIYEFKNEILQKIVTPYRQYLLDKKMVSLENLESIASEVIKKSSDFDVKTKEGCVSYLSYYAMGLNIKNIGLKLQNLDKSIDNTIWDLSAEVNIGYSFAEVDKKLTEIFEFIKTTKVNDNSDLGIYQEKIKSLDTIVGAIEDIKKLMEQRDESAVQELNEWILKKFDNRLNNLEQLLKSKNFDVLMEAAKNDDFFKKQTSYLLRFCVQNFVEYVSEIDEKHNQIREESSRLAVLQQSQKINMYFNNIFSYVNTKNLDDFPKYCDDEVQEIESDIHFFQTIMAFTIKDSSDQNKKDQQKTNMSNLQEKTNNSIEIKEIKDGTSRFTKFLTYKICSIPVVPAGFMIIFTALYFYGLHNSIKSLAMMTKPITTITKNVIDYCINRRLSMS